MKRPPEFVAKYLLIPGAIICIAVLITWLLSRHSMGGIGVSLAADTLTALSFVGFTRVDCKRSDVFRPILAVIITAVIVVNAGAHVIGAIHLWSTLNLAIRTVLLVETLGLILMGAIALRWTAVPWREWKGNRFDAV